MTHDDQCVMELTSKGRWQLTLIGLMEREQETRCERFGRAGYLDRPVGFAAWAPRAAKLQRRCLICTAFR